MPIPFAGGIGLATRTDGKPDSPSTPDSFYDFLIGAAVDAAWADYRPQLLATLQTLGRGDLIAPGITLYKLGIQLPEQVTHSAERADNGDLILHLGGGCYIDAMSTTPTAFGEWGDPHFSFAFDLDLTYRIDLPPTTQPLSATGFEHIYVLAPVLDSHNFVADLAFMANDIFNWFTGTDYVAMLEGFIASTDFAPYAQRALQPLNDELTRLAGEGFWFLDAAIDALDGSGSGLHGLSFPDAPVGRLDLLLTAFGFDRSGSIEGMISWPRSLGEPTNRPKLELTALPTERITGGGIAAAMAATRADVGAHVVTQHSVRVATEVTASQPVAMGADVTDADPSADTAIAASLAALAPAERATAASEMLAGDAQRYVSLVGGTAPFAQLQKEFLRGRSDFVVPVTVAVAGSGPFADQRPVGTLASLWADDDDTTCRRRFLMVDLPIDAPLTVSCRLADGYRWDGSAENVACQDAGWSGSVTVHPAPRLASFAEAMRDQVVVTLPDRTRVVGSTDQLEQRGIIFVGGTVADSALRTVDTDAVSLNPQPLPPKEVALDPERLSLDRVALNPQPIPPGRPRQTALHPLAGISTTPVASATAKVQASPVRTDTLATVGKETLATGAAAAGAIYVRINPTANGTVRGIDFRVSEATTPIVR